MDTFDCWINNAAAKKALEEYAFTLQKAFKQYRELWENYIKLQEIHEECNKNCDFEVDNQLGELELSPERICKAVVEPEKPIDNDTVIREECIITKDNAMNREEIISQDVIELSPNTQGHVTFKVNDFLKDKKKLRLKRLTTSSNKNKYTRSVNMTDKANAENKPPVKQTLFDDSNRSHTKTDVRAHFRTRCNSKTTKLEGHDCWECKSYYHNLPLNETEVQARRNISSRHRYKYPKPEGLWNPEFSDTMSSQ